MKKIQIFCLFFAADVREWIWIWIEFRESLDGNIILLSLDLGMLDIWISDPFRRREWNRSLGTARDQRRERKKLIVFKVPLLAETEKDYFLAKDSVTNKYGYIGCFSNYFQRPINLKVSILKERAVVVAQAVEGWHSVRATGFESQDRLCFFWKCYQSILAGRRDIAKEDRT